jgi:hypothetical protein
MLGAWLFVAIICCMLFGWVGIAIAANKGVSSGAGFWLGFFLGPIGLVIVALLSPPPQPQLSQTAVPKQFDGERDLKNDGYKLWLTSRYDIKKNDVLGSYVCQERLFPTVDAALEYANEQYEMESATAEAEKSRKAEAEAKWREADLERQRKNEELFRRWRPYLVGLSVFLLIVFSYFIYVSMRDANKQAVLQQQKADAEKQRQKALLAPINNLLASYGVAIGENGRNAAIDADTNMCIYSITPQRKEKIEGRSMHFLTATYPTNRAVDDVRLIRPTDWDDLSATVFTLMIAPDEQWLFKNKNTGQEVFVWARDETNYKPDSHLTFRTRVHLCVGKSADF